jgi:hypothetical protein
MQVTGVAPETPLDRLPHQQQQLQILRKRRVALDSACCERREMREERRERREERREKREKREERKEKRERRERREERREKREERRDKPQTSRPHVLDVKCEGLLSRSFFY